MKLTVLTKEFSNALCENGDLYRADVKNLFDTHPSVDVFYLTSDSQAFFAENMADSHGQKLKVRDYIEVTRQQVFILDEAPKDEAPADEAPKDEAPADEAPKDEAPKDEAPKNETPKDETPNDEVPKDEAPTDALAVAFATPEAERTPYQKGLITKATKATEGEAK